MTEGTVAFIDKEKIAKTCIIGGKFHDRLLIELEESRIAPLCNILGIDLNSFYSEHHGVYQVGKNPAFRGILTELEDLVKNDDSDMKTAKVKTKILDIFMRHAEWEGERIGKISERGVKSHVEKQKRVHQVADYIAENFDRIHSVGELSARFYMSDAYLCRIFNEVTNFTISEYINLYRIAASRDYLKDEKYSMTEIANILGYESLTYFERVFKKQMGITPLQYRKSRQKAASGLAQVNIV
jgi:AraC-like DNA-binding protein